MKLLTRVGNGFDRTINILAFLAALLLVFNMLSVSADVVMRYFLNRPQPWVFETTRLSLLWITFLGTAWVLRRERHVRMDLMVDRLKPRTRALFELITSVLSAVVFLIVAWYAARVTWDHYKTNYYQATVLNIPEALIVAIVPIGCFLLVVQLMRMIHGCWGRWRALRNQEHRLEAN